MLTPYRQVSFVLPGWGGALSQQCKVYLSLHSDAAAAGRTVKIGIVKDLFQFHAYKWYNVLDHLLAWICDKLFNKVHNTRNVHIFSPCLS